MMLDKVRIAIVHDYLTQKGGAERLVLAMLKAFPNADLYTSVYDPEGTFPQFSNYRIHTTFLQRIYIKKLGHRIYLPLYPVAFEKMPLSSYSLIISSTTAFAKCVKKGKAIHISYINTPPRFIWSRETYFQQEMWAFAKKIYLYLFLNYLKKKDLQAVKNIDFIISNSKNIKEKIKTLYKRESEVIYPPVEASKFYVSSTVEDFYLVVSRLVSHKRVDIVIKAFNNLGLPLKIVGRGPSEKGLKAISGRNVEFLGAVSDEVLRELYAKCRALIFPQEEDFGIVPLECMASGRPVIAFGRGGALETVIEGKTGIFFHEQTPSAIEEAVRKFEDTSFEPKEIRKHAEQFDLSVFIKKMRSVAERVIVRHGS